MPFVDGSDSAGAVRRSTMCRFRAVKNEAALHCRAAFDLSGLCSGQCEMGEPALFMARVRRSPDGSFTTENPPSGGRWALADTVFSPCDGDEESGDNVMHFPGGGRLKSIGFFTLMDRS
jgi:hypothetical protein